MKFSENDWIKDEKGAVSQIVGVDAEAKEYAFINVLGRKVWIDGTWIDETHELSKPVYPQAAFDF